MPYPVTGRKLPDGDFGEGVITTLGSEAMGLIRFRTFGRACFDRSMCKCGGVTARLVIVFGRLQGCSFPGGGVLYSQVLDELLHGVPGLIDFQVTLDSECLGVDRISVKTRYCRGQTVLKKDKKRTH